MLLTKASAPRYALLLHASAQGMLLFASTVRGIDGAGVHIVYLLWTCMTAVSCPSITITIICKTVGLPFQLQLVTSFAWHPCVFTHCRSPCEDALHQLPVFQGFGSKHATLFVNL